MEKTNGTGNFRGAIAFFEVLNKTGSINGAKVELSKAEDKFTPERAKPMRLPFTQTNPF